MCSCCHRCPNCNHHPAAKVVPLPIPTPETRTQRYQRQMLRDLETDLASVHLIPLTPREKALTMAMLIAGAAERLSWIEATA